jgi:O-antigen/teichoic acid export membrane protein
VSDFDPVETESPSRFAILKNLLSYNKLKAVLTQSSGNRGSERYRRVSLTASAAFISKALNILISFLSVPLTVHYLGAERYGVWLTISSVLTWMYLTDFGLAGNALINVLAHASGNDDKEDAREYAASCFWALMGISVASAIICGIAFNHIPFRAVFRVSDATSTEELRLACGLTLVFFVTAFPLSIQNSIYSAYQDGFLSNIWGIAANILSLIALVFVSRTHGSLASLVVALSGTRFVVAIANMFFIFRRYPWLAPRPSAVRWYKVKRLFQLGSKYLVTQLASLGIYQSQPMIITQLLGPSQVVIYVVAYKILALPVDLSYMATAPFVSAFGEAKARNDWQWIRDAYKKATKASLMFGTPMLILLSIFAKPLIRIWAGAAAVPSVPLILWMAVYTLFAIGLMAAGQLMTGLERVNPLMISVVLCAIFIIVASILLAPKWGLAGIAFGMAMSKIFTYWPIQIYDIRKIMRANGAPV